MARVSLGIGYHGGPSCSSYAALPSGAPHQHRLSHGEHLSAALVSVSGCSAPSSRIWP